MRRFAVASVTASSRPRPPRSGRAAEASYTREFPRETAQEETAAVGPPPGVLEVLAYGRERHLACLTRRARVNSERCLRSQSRVAGCDRCELPYRVAAVVELRAHSVAPPCAPQRLSLTGAGAALSRPFGGDLRHGTPAVMKLRTTPQGGGAGVTGMPLAVRDRNASFARRHAPQRGRVEHAEPAWAYSAMSGGAAAGSRVAQSARSAGGLGSRSARPDPSDSAARRRLRASRATGQSTPRPPSTTRRWPVTNEAPSDVKKLTACAMSSGLPMCPTGTVAM